MEKGQGALEYLLLIGGAVLVAVIVITTMLTLAGEGEASTDATASESAIRLCEQRNITFCGPETYSECETDTACVCTTDANKCGRGTCVPLIVCPSPRDCGSMSDGCTGTVVCGPSECGSGESCIGNVCTLTGSALCGNSEIVHPEVCDTGLSPPDEFGGETCDDYTGTGSTGNLDCINDCATIDPSDCSSGTTYLIEFACVNTGLTDYYSFTVDEASSGTTLSELTRTGETRVCNGDSITQQGVGIEISGKINGGCDNYSFDATPPFTITNNSTDYNVQLYIGDSGSGTTFNNGESITINETDIIGAIPPGVWTVPNGSADACTVYATVPSMPTVCGGGHTDNGNGTCTATLEADYDGRARRNDIMGTIYSIDSTELVIFSGGFLATIKNKGFIEWDTKDIPVGSTITSVVLLYEGSSPFLNPAMIGSFDGKPRAFAGNAQTMYDNATGSIEYITDTFPVPGSNQITLNSDAITKMESNLGLNYFAVSMNSSGQASIVSTEGGTSPTLKVKYTPP